MEFASSLQLGSSKVTGKYQITIPSEVRRSMQIPLGADVLFRVLNENQVELTVLPPPLPASELKGALKIAPEDKERVDKDSLTAGMAAFIADNYRGKEQ